MTMPLSPDASRKERAFHDADQQWMTALVAKFEERAGAARYLAEGQGEPGSELRRLYDAFCRARDLWLEEVEQENRQAADRLSGQRIRAAFIVGSAPRRMGGQS